MPHKVEIRNIAPEFKSVFQKKNSKKILWNEIFSNLNEEFRF